MLGNKAKKQKISIDECLLLKNLVYKKKRSAQSLKFKCIEKITSNSHDCLENIKDEGQKFNKNIDKLKFRNDGCVRNMHFFLTDPTE